MEYQTNKYKEILASDKLCKKFHKLGFPFEKADDKTEYKVLIGVTLYVRPTVNILNQWLAFGSLDEVFSRDKACMQKMYNIFKVEE